ncbi:hypothetical protein ACMDCR_17390 [Labrys okinawensis]|uniref:hypothetical protein n=1 Tax=Labrys okinawensis TaxID=346911 RepID=UPI0039BD107F
MSRLFHPCVRQQAANAHGPFLSRPASDVISAAIHIEKGGLRVIVYFQHHRQRGPVNALQMRLQG